MDQKKFFAQLSVDDSNFEELTRCPWCNGERYLPWGKQIYKGFISVECLECNIVYVKRRFNALGRKRLCDGYMKVRQDKGRAQQRTIAYDIELDFIYRYVDNGKVVDIGCGGGFLLEKMPPQRWIEKWGTELGSDAVIRARTALDTSNIFEGEIESLDLPIEYFDLAIARGVIEHVPFPRTFLRKITTLIKPQGFLFMSGPNLKSFCAQFYKERWKLHYPEAHLFHFSVENISQALTGDGFKLIADAYHYTNTPYANPEEAILQIAKDIKDRQNGIYDEAIRSPAFWDNRYAAIWQKQ